MVGPKRASNSNLPVWNGFLSFRGSCKAVHALRPAIADMTRPKHNHLDYHRPFPKAINNHTNGPRLRKFGSRSSPGGIARQGRFSETTDDAALSHPVPPSTSTRSSFLTRIWPVDPTRTAPRQPCTRQTRYQFVAHPLRTSVRIRGSAWQPFGFSLKLGIHGQGSARQFRFRRFEMKHWGSTDRCAGSCCSSCIRPTPLEKRAQRRRDIAFATIVRSYSEALQTGMTRKEVEDYLSARNACSASSAAFIAPLSKGVCGSGRGGEGRRWRFMTS
jgi:hypothetical protein